MNGTKKVYASLIYQRTSLGIPQETLANLIGCGKANYISKERGRVPWSLRECWIIKDYINGLLIERGKKELKIEDIFFADEVAYKPTKVIKRRRKKAI